MGTLPVKPNQLDPVRRRFARDFGHPIYRILPKDSRVFQRCWFLADQPKIPGAGDGLGAGMDVEFAVDVARVRFDRVQREVEAGGDLGVGQAAGDEPQDFEFAIAQRLQDFGFRIADVGECGVRSSEFGMGDSELGKAKAARRWLV